MSDFRPGAGSLPVPGIPPDEEDRLAALRRFEILDTAPDPAFDRLTEQAISIFGVRFALLSFVDRSRVWFKSAQGVRPREAPRNIAFCAHTILGVDPMVVRDLSRDVRFTANPLVTGAPALRFYAGVPIRSRSGHNVGTFCILDTLPYPDWDDTEENMLTTLAGMATSALDAHTRNLRLSRARATEVDPVSRSRLDQLRLAIYPTDTRADFELAPVDLRKMSGLLRPAGDIDSGVVFSQP